MGYIIIAPFLWIGGWIAASVWFRRSKGKPIVPHVPQDAAFYEDGCSGRSLRNGLTRIGGARNCLLVYVADEQLRVVPRFPFTLMFLPEIFGLDLTVPLGSITSVDPVSHVMSRAMRISFKANDPPPIELRLNDEQGFINQFGNRTYRVRASSEREFKKPRRGYKLIAFRIFMAIWGFGALAGAYSGLPDDYRFRRDGIETVGVFDNHSGIVGDRNDMGVLSYSVDGQRFHLTSLQGSGIYKIGSTARLFYLQGRPDEAREAAYLPFDLMWLCLGVIALALSLFSGRIVRRFKPDSRL